MVETLVCRIKYQIVANEICFDYFMIDKTDRQDKDDFQVNQDECLPKPPVHQQPIRKSLSSIQSKRTLQTQEAQSTLFTRYKTQVFPEPLPRQIITIRASFQLKNRDHLIFTLLEDAQQWYHGEVILGHRCGYGKQFFRQKGEYYEGKFVSNKRHGRGLMIQENGTAQICEFIGDQLIGAQLSDLASGQERLDLENGAIFIGDVQNGKRHGRGKYVWPDQTFYEGEFKNDVLEGLGKMHYADGREYRGFWRQGKMEGFGTFKWPDGKKYKGEYLSNKKHGFGVMKWKDGLVYMGWFFNGKQHGKGVLRLKEKKQTLTEWLEGKRVA